MDAAASVLPSKPEIIETPQYKERVWFVGMNGTGKTVLEAALVAPYPRVVILDIKYDFPIPWERGSYAIVTKPPGHGFLGLRFFDPWYRHDRIVYRPEKPYDNGQYITRFLESMFDRGRREGKKRPFILVIDEGGWVAYNGAKTALSRLSITGRSLGIGLWLTSQRPRGIPVEIRSEAWRVYVFYLRKEEDRKELVQILDDYADESMFAAMDDSEYSFWEIRRAKGGRLEYRRLPPIVFNDPEAGKEQGEK